MLTENYISDIYDKHAKELLVYAYSFVYSQETAEDIVHDTFVKLIQHSQAHSVSKDNMRALLYKITHNLCIDYLRRYKKIDSRPISNESSGHDDFTQTVETKDLQNKINDILSSADAKARDVYILKREQNMTFAEIAASLKISERTAKRKLNQILEYIHENLKNSGFLIFAAIIWHILMR